MRTIDGRQLLGALGIGVAVLAAAPVYAVDFSLNFQQNAPVWGESVTSGSCPLGSATCGLHDFGNGDPTPFQQTVDFVNTADPSSSGYYFHTIVGDPAAGFAIESYTRFSAGPNGTTAGVIPDNGGAFSPDSGGNETATIGNPPDFVLPQSGGSIGNTSGIGVYMTQNTNMTHPFAGQDVSGNGTGDPTKMVFRMVMTDAKGDMSMEVLKPFLDKKPRISQTVEDSGMSSSFVADMTAISYSDKNTPAVVINNLKIQDPTVGSSADFSMALSQHSDVTAGQYTYTHPAGWNSTQGGWNSASGWDSNNSSFTPGTYSYYDASGFDPLNVDWTSFFHYDENRLGCVRPGSGKALNNGVRGDMNAGTSCPGGP
jgi:hypothetical protein